MFNIGPLEMVVLAAVALLVFGPEKLPTLVKDGARMLKTLRDLAQGARTQLNNELGPEFADFDLASLNPRTAIKQALLGDDNDLSAYNPRETVRRAWKGEDDAVTQNDAKTLQATSSQATSPQAVALHNAAYPPAGSVSPVSMAKAPTPLREGEPPPFDTDTT